MLKIYIFFGFTLRLINSFWNGFFGPSFGADSDAQGYYFKAFDYSQSLKLDGFVTGDLYPYILGALFYISGPSLFVASLLSSLIWLASAYVLILVMKSLCVNKEHQALSMAVFAFLPSSVMFTSVTLREPYQLLFVNLAILSTLKIVLYKRNLYWVILLVSVVGMGVLHGALFVFGVYLVVSCIFLPNISGLKKLNPFKISFIALLVVFIVIYSSALFDAISYQLNDGLHSAVEAYQNSALGMDARSNYKTIVDVSSLYDLVISLPLTLLQYLFEPFPWHISSLVDYVSFFENLLKIYLIVNVIRVINSGSCLNLALTKWLFVSWVVLSLIWSIGTVNWGTSIRHQIPGFGFLILSAFCVTSKPLKKIVNKQYYIKNE